jgi:predicted metalloendopeptidase
MKIRRTWLVACAALGATLAGAAQTPLQSGLDLSTFDLSVRPQDDLFRHVNGGWLTRTEIPPDRATYGTFVQLIDKAEADLHAIIQEAAGQLDRRPGTPVQQIGDLFASFMDEGRVNALGATPLSARLAEIDAVRTPAELAAHLGRLSMIGLPGPVGGFVEADAGDPSKTALYLHQGGIALPDRDYYLVADSKFEDIRTKYRQYLEKVFALAGRPNGPAAARAVLALETELARMQWTRVEARDAVKTYNKYPVSKLVQEMPGFDWLAWARPQSLDQTPEWIIGEPSFFRGFAAIVPKTPLDTWKAWTAAQLITLHAPLLSQPFQDASFEFFARTLSGQQEQRARWKRGVQFVNSSVGEALGQLYVARHFPAGSKARMEGLIANLIEAYRQSITELDWMTAETRKEALGKLARFTSKIGYPNRWRDYSALKISRDDLVGNAERANFLESEYQIGKLGKPVDREEWLMTPQTVNAYYNGLKNEIVFPAAILQAPFFNVAADDAVNYGAIGAIIGHEIGHGFDDQGRRYDGDGRLRDWWRPQDEAQFARRAKLLIEQYSAYSPLPGVRVNGELTLGENIGDLGGLSIAHRAWKISLAGRPSPVIDGLTGDQRYFMGWVQGWRAKAREEYLRQQVLADPHAWAEFRANGPLGNIPAFYEAFGVTPIDKLYRRPEVRVKIW